MKDLTIQLPDDLAQRLKPVQDRLPEIIELGLRYWQGSEAAPLTPRQQVEQVWAKAGLVVSPAPPIVDQDIKLRRRQKPLKVGGKPASEIIIEQRGPLVEGSLSSLIFISADNDLLAAAAAEGLPIDNPNDHPPE